MVQPLLSIAIITYNHEGFIRKCLEGVMMQQTNFPFEVIVAEDCSTDNTRSIVQEFERRYPDIIKPIYQKKNVGAARNVYEFCFPALKGKYIAICEGDDYWTDPEKLQKQIDFLAQNREFAMCFHRINTVDQNDKIIEKQIPDENVTLYSPQNIFHLSIPTLSVVFRNLIKSIPLEMKEVKSGDTFLFGMLSSFGGAADMGFVGANYRKHNGGVFNQLPPVEQYRQSLMTRKLMKLSRYFNGEQKREIRKELIKRKKLYIKSFLLKGQILNCLKIIFI